ncbi:MAG: hypothetical protein ACRD9S_02870 [Pyrinomonadaceae bacterium]
MKSNGKVRYDGSACLNVRSVAQACHLLTGESAPRQPFKWSDLATVLWFVETCVTSKQLFFDGTVPKKTAQTALESVEQLKLRHELNLFEVSSIAFDDPRDVLAAARDAFAESRLLIDNFTLDPTVDRPLDQTEHENFVKQLALATAASAADRESLALEWVTDAFRGSKCLAAITAGGDLQLEGVRWLYEKHPKQGPSITAALINRFRLNYVNQLASQKRSAYVPDPTFESLTKEHVRLFKDYLIKRVVEELQDVPVAPASHNILIENMKAETPLPPIGLYALMATKARNRPGAILETAYNEFRKDDALMKVIWKNTKGGIGLSKQRSDDDLSEIEAYFYENYKELEKRAAGIKELTSKNRRARTYLIPAFLKGLAKVIPESLPFGIGKVYTVLRETASEASIPFISDYLLGEGCDTYISQYQSLKWDFQKDDAVKTTLATLTEQVERVFGRQLV